MKAFRARLWRYPGSGGWTFARIPAKHAPPATHAWGRTPVHATVDGRAWATSVWRDRAQGTLLPVPRRLLGDKGDGDSVMVALRPRVLPALMLAERPRPRKTEQRQVRISETMLGRSP